MRVQRDEHTNHPTTTKWKIISSLIPNLKNELSIKEFFSVYRCTGVASREVTWTTIKKPDRQTVTNEVWIIGHPLYIKEISWEDFIHSLEWIRILTSCSNIVYFTHPREINLKLPDYVHIKELDECFEMYLLSADEIAESIISFHSSSLVNLKSLGYDNVFFYELKSHVVNPRFRIRVNIIYEYFREIGISAINYHPADNPSS